MKFTELKQHLPKPEEVGRLSCKDAKQWLNKCIEFFDTIDASPTMIRRYQAQVAVMNSISKELLEHAENVIKIESLEETGDKTFDRLQKIISDEGPLKVLNSLREKVEPKEVRDAIDQGKDISTLWT